MRRLTFSVVVACSCLLAHAQTAQPGGAGLFTFGKISGLGQVGSTVSFVNTPSSPSNYSLTYVVSGTAPTACSLELDGSLDGTNWFPVSAPNISCTASGAFSVAERPFAYIRALASAYTPGDATTTVTLTYARGVD